MAAPRKTETTPTPLHRRARSADTTLPVSVGFVAARTKHKAKQLSTYSKKRQPRQNKAAATATLTAAASSQEKGKAKDKRIGKDKARTRTRTKSATKAGVSKPLKRAKAPKKPPHKDAIFACSGILGHTLVNKDGDFRFVTRWEGYEEATLEPAGSFIGVEAESILRDYCAQQDRFLDAAGFMSQASLSRAVFPGPGPTLPATPKALVEGDDEEEEQGEDDDETGEDETEKKREKSEKDANGALFHNVKKKRAMQPAGGE